MNAEIVAIGTELLLGEIVDTNTSAVARALRSIGVDLFRTTVVGDNADRIAQVVREGLDRCQVVITTGGLGPTVDDVTRQGVALALGVDTEFRPELWEQIQERFARYGRAPTENNRRQAMIPQGATAIENPVGTAPAFLAETERSVVVALPGGPAEMTYLLESAVLPYLRSRLGQTSLIKSRLIRTAGAGESWIDERIQDLEQLSNPTLGLSAHPGQVDLRLTVKASTEEEADKMLAGPERVILERLGAAAYGFDNDTLEQVVSRQLQSRGWRIAVVEQGTGGAVAAALGEQPGVLAGGHLVAEPVDVASLAEVLHRSREEFDAQAGLGLSLARRGDRHALLLRFEAPGVSQGDERSYGGPPASAARWALNISLDFVRRLLS